jgi:hypothetical protein
MYFGFRHSEESKRKMSNSHKGLIGNNKGKHWKVKDSSKMGKDKIGHPSGMLGKHHTDEARRKIGLSRVGILGKLHPSWKGGLTPLMKSIRNNDKYKAWRLSIFERDFFTCQMPGCGQRGSEIRAHHIKKFIDLIREYNIKTLEEALNCCELWLLANGITLCEKCHKKTYHKEEQFKDLFLEIIKHK